MLSCPPPRCFKPWMERLLSPPPCRTAPVVLRLGEPSGVPFLVGRRHGNNARYPSVCVCTSSSSSSPSPLPPPYPILPVANTTAATTTTAPVTSSGATVVSTTITTTAISAPAGPTSPIVKKRKRYRKAYPGESKGIVEEMRFVAMRLRNDGKGGEVAGGGSGEGNSYGEDDAGEGNAGEGGETWHPSMGGFLRYLVDSMLIFETIERTVDQSEDVTYAYFRKTGLERSNSLSKDLDWFSNQGITIPDPSTPGTTYATYLSELAESSAPSFLCHVYNIYFAHATGGQEIGKQVCEKLLDGRELEFYKWEGDVFELLQGTREKLNKLGKHWSRDDKNRCLREAAKCFRFLGQIVRLIIIL